MTSLEDLQRGLVAADAAGNTDDAKVFADAIRSHPDQPGGGVMDTLSRFGQGIVGGFQRQRARVEGGSEINPAFPPELQSEIAANRATHAQDLAGYEAKRPSLGTAAKVGEITSEVLPALGPTAALSGGVSRAPILAKTLGPLARRVVGDVVASGSYEGGKRLLEGATAKEAATDAAWAAGGAGVFSTALGAVGKAVGRLTAARSPQAAKMLADGLVPTPGQAYPGGATAAVEEVSKGIPGFGKAVESAQARPAGEYISQLTRDALKPMGAEIQGMGLQATKQAEEVFDNAYREVLPRTFLQPNDAMTAVQHALQDIDTMPLTGWHMDQVNAYVKRTLIPEIQKTATQGGPSALISGHTANEIDKQIGTMARNYADGSPIEQPIGEAFYALQRRLRVALDAVDPTDKARLAAIRESFRNFLPIREAVESSLATSRGIPSPVALRDAIKKAGMKPDALNDAVVETVGTATPGSKGRAARATIGTALGITNLPLAAGIWGAGTAVGKTLYSRAGVKAMLAAMGLPRQTMLMVQALPLADQVAFVTKMTRPGIQAGSQLGQQIQENRNAP